MRALTKNFNIILKYTHSNNTPRQGSKHKIELNIQYAVA